MFEKKLGKIPFVQSALRLSKKQIKLFASAWTIPPWMKTNNDYKGNGTCEEICASEHAFSNQTKEVVGASVKLPIKTTEFEYLNTTYPNLQRFMNSQNDWILNVLFQKCIIFFNETSFRNGFRVLFFWWTMLLHPPNNFFKTYLMAFRNRSFFKGNV